MCPHKMTSGTVTPVSSALCYLWKPSKTNLPDQIMVLIIVRKGYTRYLKGISNSNLVKTYLHSYKSKTTTAWQVQHTQSARQAKTVSKLKRKLSPYYLSGVIFWGGLNIPVTNI